MLISEFNITFMFVMRAHNIEIENQIRTIFSTQWFWI